MTDRSRLRLVSRYLTAAKEANPAIAATNLGEHLVAFLEFVALRADPLDVFDALPPSAIAGAVPIAAEAACDQPGPPSVGYPDDVFEPGPLVVTDHRAGAEAAQVVVQNDATDVVAALAASLGDGSRVAAIVTADQLAVIIRALYAVPHCNRSLRAEVGRVLPPLLSLYDEAFGSWSSPDPNDDDDRPAAA